MNIVITGASGAIGAALSQVLHARGDSLLLCGRDLAKRETLNAAMDGVHSILVADLSGLWCRLPKHNSLRWR